MESRQAHEEHNEKTITESKGYSREINCERTRKCMSWGMHEGLGGLDVHYVSQDSVEPGLTLSYIRVRPGIGLT